MTRYGSGPLALLTGLFLATPTGCIRSTDGLPPPAEGGSIVGTVEELRRGSETAEGAEGVAVRALGTGISATTDRRGFFQLNRLPLGVISISIERRDADDRVIAARILDPIDVEVDGQAFSLGDIALADLGSVSGEAALQTAPGEPLVRIGGTLVVAARTPFKAVTGEGGTFRMPGLPEGRLDLVAFETGFRPARRTGIQVRPGVETQARPLILERIPDRTMVVVEGQVSLQDETDASNVEVELLDEADPMTPAGTDTTDPDGAFSIEVPPAVYRARFRRDGFTPVEIAGVAVLREGVVLGLRPVLLITAPSTDVDADGIADAEDPDRDNDGCRNEMDDFPDDPFECLDTDGDGVANRLDPDDDNDTLTDFEEDSPGEDRFVTDRLNPDTDGDGFGDAVDTCPTIRDPDQTGRACTDLVAPLPPPLITGFSPERAGALAPVTIEGENFSPEVSPFHTVQFGPGGAFAAPIQVTDNRMLVNVPYGARTGTISVLVGDQVASSARVFTFLEPPEVVRTVPGEARPAGRVVVFGRGFDQPNLRLSLDGRDITVDTCAPGEGDNAQNLEALCFNVPLEASSGPLLVESDNGPAQRRPRLVILSGPFVRDVQPRRTERGQTVVVFGGGFDTTDTGGEVRVRFAGSAASVSAVLLDDAEVWAIVPPDAQNGPVTVEHPAGNATSPFDLVVDTDGPVILGISLTLIQAEDTLFINGLNLETASLVRFGGGVTAVPTSATAGGISVIVPDGVAPGPATLEFPGGDSVTTTARLSVLETDGPIDVTTAGSIAGWSYVGREIYVPTLDDARTVVVLDDDTFQVSRTFTLQGITPDASDTFVVHPLRPLGVWTSFNQNRTNVLRLPDLASRPTTCADRGASPLPPVVHRTQPFAFAFGPHSLLGTGETGVLRVNLEEGSCEVLRRSTGNPEGAVGLRDDDLLVYRSDIGVGLIDVNGDIVIQFGPFQSTGSYGSIFASLRGDVYGLPRITSSNLARLPFPASGQAAVPITAPTRGHGALSANRRWLLIAPRNEAGDSHLVDLLANRVARSFPGLDGDRLTAHPTTTRFVVGLSQELGRRARRFTIRE